MMGKQWVLAVFYKNVEILDVDDVLFSASFEFCAVYSFLYLLTVLNVIY